MDPLSNSTSSIDRRREGEGFIYACCQGEEYNSTKCGFTTTSEPVLYCHKNYGRTMVPLNIIYISQVPNAALAESMLFCALSEHRIDINHEVFSVTRDVLQTGFESVAKSFDCLRAVNAKLSRVIALEIPDEPEMRPQSAGLSVNQIRKQEAADRRNERIKKYEEEKQLKVEQEEKLQLELVEKLQEFLQQKCVIANDLKVQSQKLYEAFKSFSCLQISAATFNREMSIAGFDKKKVRLGANTFQGFKGLSVAGDSSYDSPAERGA